MAPSPYRDRIVVFGGSREALGLLHLAAVRIDDVVVLASASDKPMRAAAKRLGAVRRGLGHASVEFAAAAAVLVAEGRPAAQEALASSAQARRRPGACRSS